jgi:hypothetical protein
LETRLDHSWQVLLLYQTQLLNFRAAVRCLLRPAGNTPDNLQLQATRQTAAML